MTRSFTNFTRRLFLTLVAVFMAVTSLSFGTVVRAEDSDLLKTDKDTYTTDDEIMVTAQGSGRDWVGLYKKGEVPGSGGPTAIFYYYVEDEEESFDIFKSPNHSREDEVKDEFTGGFSAGEYTLYLCANDGYEVLAQKDITVKDPLLKTNKKEYETGEPINVILNKEYTYDGYIWVALYEKDAVPGTGPVSYRYYDNSGWNIYDTIDIMSGANDNNLTVTAGDYDIILMYQSADGNWYNVVTRKTIKIVDPIPTDMALDFDNAVDSTTRAFRFGDPIYVTATSASEGAWVGIIKRNTNVDHYYNYYYVKDHQGEKVNIFDMTAGNEGTLAEMRGADFVDPPNSDSPGRYNIVLFSDGYDVAKIISVWLLKVYEPKEWTWAEDYSTATVTFVSNDDGTEKTLDATVTYEETKAPTCTEAGENLYTATVDTEEAFQTKDKESVYTKQTTGPAAALGHEWGEWEVVRPATETEEGLERRYCKRDPEHFEERVIPKTDHVHTMEHFEAKPATCEEDGNSEYWYCKGCDKYYSDAEGEHEIDKDSWIIKALGHNYGDWQHDDEKDQHFKVCANDPSHKIVEDCDYEKKEVKDGVIKYECKVCHGVKEVVALATDKKEYKYNEPIMVEANLDAIADLPDFVRDHAWIGFYPKGVVPGPNLSIFWYYIDKEGSPFNVLDGVCDANGLLWQYKPGGEYSIFLCQNEGYDYVTSVDIKISEEVSGDISLELNGNKQENAQQTSFVETDLSVKFKAAVEGDCGSAWIGLYKEKVSTDMDFKSYQSAKYWNLYDIVDQEIDITSEVSTPGWYTMVVFGDGGYEDKRMYINFEVTKEIVSEAILKEATCDDYGSKEVTYKDGTTEIVLIPPLGHDWGEWETVKEATCEEAGEEKRICKNDEKHSETREIKALGHAFGNWKFDEETHTHTGVCEHDKTHTLTEDCTFKEISRDGDKVTYECEICGGKYTAVEAADEIVRIFDATRFGTSMKAAEELKYQKGIEKFNAVVIANGLDFADALAGSYLAYVKNAPILITADMFGGKEVYKDINDYIKANLAEDGTVYVLGGDKAVSPKAIADLGSYNVKRLAGETRYETNLKILEEAGASGEDLLVCTAYNYADSLSGSAAKKPILLVAKGGLRDDQKAYLKDAGAENIYIAGGKVAVSEEIEADLETFGKVTRLAGETRYETSVRIAEQFFSETDSAVLTYAYNFPDGLCGGPVAAAMNAPLILTATGNVEAAANYADGLEIKSAVILGGVSLISDDDVRDILRLDKDTEIKVK